MKKEGIQTRRRKSKKTKSPKKHLTAPKQQFLENNYDLLQVNHNIIEDKCKKYLLFIFI